MKKNIFALRFFLFFVFLGYGPCAHAFSTWQEKFCPKESEVELVFESSYGKLTYDTSKSADFLKNLSKRKGNEFVFGLTVPNPTVEVNVRTQVKQLLGEACVVPMKVEIFFGYVDPTIYLAEEIKNNTCKRSLVLRHEQTHMQISILALEYFLPQINRLIRKKLVELKPVMVPAKESKIKATSDAMSQMFMDRMDDLAKQFNAFLIQEQNKLDNSANYAFEESICSKKQSF